MERQKQWALLFILLISLPGPNEALFPPSKVDVETNFKLLILLLMIQLTSQNLLTSVFSEELGCLGLELSDIFTKVNSPYLYYPVSNLETIDWDTFMTTRSGTTAN